MSDVLNFLVSNSDALLTAAALLLSAVAVFLPDNPVVRGLRGVLDLVRSLVKRKPAPPAEPVALEGEESQELKPDVKPARERLDRPRS